MNLLLRSLFACLLLLGLVQARAAEDFLPPEQAFRFSARMVDASTAELRYRIADGYYMYRDNFRFSAHGAQLGEAAIPRGTVKFDPNFEKDVETLRGELRIRVPVEAAGDWSACPRRQ